MTKKFSQDFLYTQKLNGKVFSSTPQGRLHLNRLLLNEEAWEQTHPSKTATQLQKRSLILADWRMGSWSWDQLKSTATLCEQLIAEGFNVYVWQKPHCIPLTKSILLQIKQQDWSPVDINEIITTAIAQLNVTFDDIAVLDDHRLYCLLHNKEISETPRFVNISDFKSLKKHLPTWKAPLILSYLESASPAISIIANDDSLFINPAHELINRLPQAQVINKPKINPPSILRISKNTPLHDRDITQLTHRFRSVESLCFDNCNIINTFISNLYFDSLEEFVINNTDLSDQSWEQILSRSPQLKYLLLNHTTINIKTSDLKLKHLQLKNMVITGDNFVNLVNNNPLLEILELYNVKISEISESNISFKLPNLRRLAVVVTDAPKAILYSLFSEATQLKIFVFDGQGEDINTCPLPDLHHAKHIIFKGSSIQASRLKTILADTPELHSLNLNNNSMLTEDFLPHTLNHLEVLKIDSTPVVTNDSFFEKLPKLKYLERGSGAIYITKPLMFLEKLWLCKNNINSEELLNTLHLTPNLHCLSARQCPNIGGKFIPPNSLKSLVELDLFGSPISNEIVEDVLTQIPQLRTLWLQNCYNITRIKTPNNLHILDISGTNVPYAHLELMIAHMQKLYHIGLNHPPEEPLKRVLTRISFNYPMVAEQDAVNTSQPNIADERHDHQMCSDLKPIPTDYQFTYKKHQSFDQNMIITQLSQYLTLTNQDLHIIPLLQKGICYSLAHLFLDNHYYIPHLDMMQKWDGERHTLTPLLCALFEQVYAYVNRFQFNQNKNLYIGDGLSNFLKHNKKNHIFSNPWHTIAIKYYLTGWVVYDPNFKTAIKECDNGHVVAIIKQSLGNLISVEETLDWQPTIRDPNQFIEEGGLLSFLKAYNTQRIIPLLPIANTLSKKALSGLLLRNNTGVPIWVLTLCTPESTHYTLNLLHYFIEKNQNDYKQQLIRSMKEISEEQRKKCLEILANVHINKPTLLITLKALFYTPYYEQLLQTRTHEIKTSSLLEFCHHQLGNGQKRQLIECTSINQLTTLHLTLEYYCKQTSVRVFYADKPEHLVCSAPYIVHDIEHHTGTIQRGPGNPLHQFLIQQQEQPSPSILIINYANFTPEAIAQFNSILDEKSHADGTPVPQHIKIIGLLNKNAAFIPGADFYSFFGLNGVSICPKVNAHPIALPLVESSEEESPVIDLYHSPSWQELLLGKWTIAGDTFFFIEGALASALKTNAPITIHNGLWANPQFIHFWQQALIRGYIEYYGLVIPLPDNLQFIRKEGYDWDELSKQANALSSPAPSSFVLNPVRSSEFFHQYDVIPGSQTLQTLPGLIEQHAGQTVNLHITRQIDSDEWARFLKQCQLHQVHLNYFVHPNQPPEQISWDGTLSNTLLLVSTDNDVTLKCLTQPDFMVIDVSECDGTDLLTRLNGQLNPQSLKLEFNRTVHDVFLALEKQKTVVLKGIFSPELVDALAPLLLQRITEDTHTGQLILLTENASSFNYMPQYIHSVTYEEKQTALQQQFSADEISLIAPLIEQEPFCKLHARLIYNRIQPLANPWQGIDALPIMPISDDFDIEHVSQKAYEFNQQRLNAVEAVLKHAAYVFLTGLTGVGKSTFVEKNFTEEKGYRLYGGETRLQDWALDTTPGKKKVIFLDEANLSPRQWSEFEGLYNDPPGLFINGRYYPLTEEHKVIFAGNPVNYGDARQLAPFFARHGNALVFEAMPHEFIHHYILAPIFANTSLEPYAAVLCEPFRAVYSFLCKCATDKILISPRELQMMALFLVSLPQQIPFHVEAYLSAARDYAYHIASTLVPEAHRPAFDAQFKPQNSGSNLWQPMVLPNGFVLTESRLQLIKQLNQFLELRRFKRSQATNEDQRYGGLGGLIIEGETGVGKSEFLIAALHANGYTEVDHQAKNIPEKSFYRIPVSMGIEEKTELRMKALHQGAIVIIEDINCSSLSEQESNALLTGRTLEHQRPDNPGFLLIGTQKPVSLAGRRKPSAALCRRLMTVYMPEYTSQEMYFILTMKGVESHIAQAMIDAYQKYKTENKAQGSDLTFRTLSQIANGLIEEKQRQQLLAFINRVNVTRPLINSETPENWPAPTQPKVLTDQEPSVHATTINFFKRTHSKSDPDEQISKKNRLEPSVTKRSCSQTEETPATPPRVSS